VFFTPLSQALRLMIHLGEPLPEARLNEFHFDFSVLGLFFLLPYALMMWTNGVGASTGMFVPALAVGATGHSRCLTPAGSLRLLKLQRPH
jgi:chloride channel 7